MRRFLIIGFIVALLIAAPLVAFILIQQKTNTQSHANPASSLLFEDLTDPVVVGQPVKVTVDVNPSSNGTSNSVSFVKLTISYDGSKLQADNSSLVPDTAFPVTLEGPTNNCNGTACTITATLSIGPDPTKAIATQAPVATITFKPLAATDANAPIKLDFVSGQNQILSLATSDQPAENVFTRGIPLSMTIVTADSLSGTPPADGGNTNNSTPTDTPAPSSDSSGTSGGSSGTTANQPPVCTTITVQQDSSDSSGMTYTVEAKGTDSDGTIGKVTFNFGDGSVQPVTDGDTIGTNSIDVSGSHAYSTSGTFTVSALMTDDQGAISTPSTCTKAVTVGNAPAPTKAPGVPTPTPIPANPQNIPATGPGDTLLFIGLAGAGLAVLGGLFFLGL